MEDIDKNGDGFIDLDEYIGEFSFIVISAPSIYTTPFWVVIGQT